MRLVPRLLILFAVLGLTAPALGDSPLAPLVRVLASDDEVEVQKDILRGMEEAFRGRRKVAAPEAWAAASARLSASTDPEVRQRTVRLSVLFGDAAALKALRATVADTHATVGDRQSALQVLIEGQAADLAAILRPLLDDPAMRGPALRGLAAVKAEDVPALVLARYSAFTDAEKADAIQTLAARAESARALLDAMEKGQVPRRDLTPFTARQVLALKAPGLADRLNAVWGTIRPTAQDKSALLARYKALVPPEVLKKADRSAGRAVFARTCAACHVLFGEGGKVGPELTGSQRTNPEYILTKVLDPSAVVARDYQVTLFTTRDGRVISGIVKSETDKVIAVQTVNEVLNLLPADIEERNRTPQSIMPEGQLAALTDAEVRDLLAYLAGEGQAALPAAQRQEKR